MSTSSPASANQHIADCISSIKEILPAYWNSTLQQRLAGGAGSCYDAFNSVEELEMAILTADWEETSHPSVPEGCRVFRTLLPGRFGLAKIADLPEDTILTADDRKNTQRVSLTLSGTRGEMVEYSYLITGLEQDREVVFTVHPGEPIAPSKVTTEELAHGSTVSKAKALELGFIWAKLV